MRLVATLVVVFWESNFHRAASTAEFHWHADNPIFVAILVDEREQLWIPGRMPSTSSEERIDPHAFIIIIGGAEIVQKPFHVFDVQTMDINLPENVVFVLDAVCLIAVNVRNEYQ